MLSIPNTLKRAFEKPGVIFTLAGNPISEKVIQQLTKKANGTDCRIVTAPAEIQAMFANGHSSARAVAVFDGQPRNHFSPVTRSRPEAGKTIPEWAKGAQWGVVVGSKCNDPERCANQIAADFISNFDTRLEKGYFPWGMHRKYEESPQQIVVSADEVLARLNSGPDLARSIANEAFALELPPGSRISWVRIPPEPIFCDRSKMTATLAAFADFERVSAALVETNEEVRAILLAGVDLPDRDLADFYLFPPRNEFSIRRLDLHFTGAGVFASENDEMPGGFPELFHVDESYGVNKDQWRKCFDWLTADGLLLFVVSSDWSKPYIAEMSWLAERMRGLGYAAKMITSEQLGEISFRDGGVFHLKERVGTIWRQFPIFETEGGLAEMVRAAKRGEIRMVPEFAHFGNKAWFSIFRRWREFFQSRLSAENFAILDELLPDSHLVLSADSFPATVAGLTVGSFEQFRRLPQDQRDRLVLKVVGANNKAARSYGVLMGHNLTEVTWQAWIDERLNLRQPFIIQSRLETAVVKLPVHNQGSGRGEAFHCRILLRPWEIGGEIVSISACAVPSSTLRVHGRVDMAVAPVVLTD